MVMSLPNFKSLQRLAVLARFKTSCSPAEHRHKDLRVMRDLCNGPYLLDRLSADRVSPLIHEGNLRSSEIIGTVALKLLVKGGVFTHPVQQKLFSQSL